MMAVTLRPFTASMRMVTMGVRCTSSCLRARRSESRARPDRPAHRRTAGCRRLHRRSICTRPSRLACTRYTVLSRNAPKPSASVTARVWFAGRCRLAMPWRNVNGHDGRVLRRATAMSSAAATHNTATAPVIPALMGEPVAHCSYARDDDRRQAPPAVHRRRGARDRATRGVARPESASRRMACSGETPRSASSGRMANMSATHSRSPSPSKSGMVRARPAHRLAESRRQPAGAGTESPRRASRRPARRRNPLPRPARRTVRAPVGSSHRDNAAPPRYRSWPTRTH